jgi:hypothetical protein
MSSPNHVKKSFTTLEIDFTWSSYHLLCHHKHGSPIIVIIHSIYLNSNFSLIDENFKQFFIHYFFGFWLSSLNNRFVNMAHNILFKLGRFLMTMFWGNVYRRIWRVFCIWNFLKSGNHCWIAFWKHWQTLLKKWLIIYDTIKCAAKQTKWNDFNIESAKLKFEHIQKIFGKLRFINQDMKSQTL